MPLSQRYWYLEGTRATRVDVELGEFWDQLMTGNLRDDIVRHIASADGWLVTVYDMESDTPHEEMHPHGDELHVLVSGRFDLVLAHPGGDAVVPMHPGDCANVPRGIWHRFVVHEPARGLSLTAGRGTEHRPIPTVPPEESR